jgi:RHS repeat-associated protein
VGGLLAIREAAGNGSSKAGQAIFPAYDGNGNIIRLTDSNGATVASYAYDGFGNRINPAASDIDSSGYANENHYGFSTKPRDPLTGLLYYGYRWYDPATGRWPSRDPIGERGGVNLYGFVGNDGANWSDLLGMAEQPTNGLLEESHRLRDSDSVGDNFLAMAYGLAGVVMIIPEAICCCGVGTAEALQNRVEEVREGEATGQIDGLEAALNRLGITGTEMITFPLTLPSVVASEPGAVVEGCKRLPGSIKEDFDRWLNQPNVSNSYDIFELGTIVYSGFKLGQCVTRARAVNIQPKVGKTVLGKYPYYINYARDLSAKRFSIPKDVWSKMSKAEQWEANKKFLDRMVARGDEIVLANIVTDLEEVTGSFRKELDYLIEHHGFKLNKEGTRLVR